MKGNCVNVKVVCVCVCDVSACVVCVCVWGSYAILNMPLYECMNTDVG